MANEPKNLVEAVKLTVEAKRQAAEGDLASAVASLTASVEWLLRSYDSHGVLKD